MDTNESLKSYYQGIENQLVIYCEKQDFKQLEGTLKRLLSSVLLIQIEATLSIWGNLIGTTEPV